ncbi:Protein N-lysine methyltransferase METTL21A [Euphorbia peplus]|nr:Protein N-lysine methyltransferase METTL21A [Euphorbia peplus]
MEMEMLEGKKMTMMGSYGGEVKVLTEGEEGAWEEIMVLWGIQQPTFSKQNSFVSQSSLELRIDACGHSLNILQSPSSLGKPGVTGSVMWDSGVLLGKFLEHSVDSNMLTLQGKKLIELGAGCGFVGCIAALLGAHVTLTDLPDRLRLLRKNIHSNLGHGSLRGSAVVQELIWGDHPHRDLVEPLPDYIVGSDVIYSEGAVKDLLDTLMQLSGTQTTIFLAGELRNDAVLEYFLEAAMQDFIIGRVEQTQWHPDYCSSRVVLYALIKNYGVRYPLTITKCSSTSTNVPLQTETIKSSSSSSSSAASVISSKKGVLQTLEEDIEKVIYRCRFLAILGVFGSLIGSILCFIKGCTYVMTSFMEYFVSRGKVIILLVEAIDVYLLGTVMLVFGMGLYELFVSNLDTKNMEGINPRSNLLGLFTLKERPRWLEVKTVNQLKTKLGHVIVMLLLIGFFEKSKTAAIFTAADLLCFATSVLLCSLSLFLLAKLAESK